jgi:GNAT superfamily N-acetyltransferase
MAGAAWIEDQWLARMHRSMEAAWRAVAAGSEGGHLVEAEGVLAAVIPALPGRSVFNSVLYERAENLAAARDDVARAYEDAGVYAWTVWVPEADRACAKLLASAGHVLDTTPRAMALDLSELRPPRPGDLEWTAAASLDDLKRVNDAAYGDEPGTFDVGIGTPPAEAWRLYSANMDGRAASVLATTDVDGDCGVWWVATLPEARGRGLAARLLGVALAEARARGMRTSTLQSTKLGRPVYERLGYMDLCELGMWELRRQPAA